MSQNIKEKEISLQDPFYMLLHNDELLLNKKKLSDDIEHKVLVDEDKLKISVDENRNYE